MSRRFLPYQRRRNSWLAFLLTPALSLSAQSAILPDDGEAVTIDTAGSPPVHGESDVGNVSVTVTSEGSIDAAGEAAVNGSGENWSLHNKGNLRQKGNSDATVRFSEGTFTNQGDGEILWKSDGGGAFTTDGEKRRFSSIFIESWIADAANHGTVRATVDSAFVFNATDLSVSLTGVHLGSRNKAEDGSEIGFTNSGDISAIWSGGPDAAGGENELRITGLHLEEFDLVDNESSIEARFEGAIDDLGGNNSLNVAGIRADKGADIVNFEESTIRAEIDASGSVGDNAKISATGIDSEGKLVLDNRGTIEAKIGDGLLPETPGERVAADATGLTAGDGAAILNRANGRIVAQNATNGNATAISIHLEETFPADPPGEDDENDDEEPVEPLRSSINNSGAIRARAGEGGTATAVFSDGHLTVTNSGTIEVGGIIISDGDDEEIEIADVADATAVHVRNGTGNITNKGTISAEGGTAVHLEEGGILRNHKTIIGDVSLGDGDATLGITPDSEIDGNVDGGGGTNTLELMNSGNIVFGWEKGEYGGEFSNFTSLLVNAKNTIWTLTGDQTYADGTAIENGVVISKDTITSDMSIGREGIFVSSGKVVGNIDNSGGLLVGTLNEKNEHAAPENGGILDVDGNITFENGSFLQVLAGETWVEASGNVVIGSEDPEDEAPAPKLFLIDADWDQDYLILKGGSIAGEFDPGSGFILLDLTYENNSINGRLGINRDAIENAGETSNQRSLARVLANLQPETGSELEGAFREFAEVGNPENFGIIAQSMNGEILASGTAAHSSFNRSIRQTVINTIQYRPNLYDDRFAPPPGTSEEEIRARDKNLWARTLSIWGDLDRPGDAGDVDYRLYGAVAGYDTVWTEDTRAGFALALGDSKVSQGSDRITGNVYQGILYGSKHTHGFLYDATLGYGYHDLKSRRNVLPGNTTTRASYGAHEFFGSAQVTMLLQEEGVLILPIAGIDFTHFRQGSFKESGVWGLSGSKTDISSVRPFVGIRILAEHLTGGGGSVVPEIRFRLSNELLDRDASFSSGFVNDTSGGRFSTTGAAFSSTEFEMGTGVVIQPGNWEQLAILGDYDFSVQRQHSISLGLRYNF